jgi:3-deoxy-D-manno-octulosonic-acid transferase
MSREREAHRHRKARSFRFEVRKQREAERSDAECAARGPENAAARLGFPMAVSRADRLLALAAGLAVLTTPFLPLWAAVVALQPRLQRDRDERLGLAVPPAAVGALWIHAASVGEIGAAEALIPHLNGPILLTADTDTGAERARAIAAANRGVVAAARPIDHPWTLAPAWAEARPRGLIFVEGTYWPNLAACAIRAGVPVMRVSAKAGVRTRAWPSLQSWLHADRVVARDEGEAAFLGGVVGGDLKGDRPLPANPLAWSRRFVVGASTRPGDEDALLDAIAAVPGAALLLAPRHPERFAEVERALRARGARFARRSTLGERVPDDVDVVLLDTIGELAGCLRGAAAAFVGGTFDAAIGGHSPVEAGRMGVPVVAGPHVHANSAAFEAVDAVRIGAVGELGAGLAAAVARGAVPRHAAASTVGSAGGARGAAAGDLGDQDAANGAGARTAAEIADIVDGRPAPEASPRPWAAPAGFALGWIASARNAWWDRRSPVRLGVPVVSIGSTNARGPGKTSTARWFARALRDRGHTVGIATRGYGRARAGSDVRIGGTDAADLGDEGALLAGEGFLVAAGPDRVECGRRLVSAGATVVVLDDGLQHRRLHRDVDLLVLDARFPGARGLLPAGERREREAIPGRITGIIVHHSDEPGAVAVAGAAIARRSPGNWRRDTAEASPPEGPVAAFAGVARPADFLAGIELPVARFRVLADHAVVDQALADALVAWAGGLPLVTTAKDRVRLPEPLRSTVWWRDVELAIDGVPEGWLPPIRRPLGQ